MSIYAIEAKGAPTIWICTDAQGNITTHEQTEDERSKFVVIRKRGEYTVRIVAIAEPFEMARAEQFGGGTQQMTKLLLVITSEHGYGKMTTILVSWSLSPKANLGKVFAAATGKRPATTGSNDPVDMLDCEFTAYFSPSEKTDDNGDPSYTTIAWDTVAPVTNDDATAIG